MKRFFQVGLFLFALTMVGTGLALARGVEEEYPPLVEGAQLYDRWYAALGVEPPSGDMPIWRRQSTNTRSGADTWRCSECHGWDYKGAQGAYGSGSHYTGFPSLMITVPNLTAEEIVAHLKGGKDPAHDLSAYMDDAALGKIALFLKEGLIDDSEYIDSLSLKVIAGDFEHGQSLYAATCAECHGEDGRGRIFRTEGVDETLGDVARRDPWRFLHRTRFGVAGSEMPVGYTLGWTPADGRDVLMYAQSLPAAQVSATPQPPGPQTQPTPLVGGPARDLWTGILTGLAAFLGTLGGSILFLSILVLIGVVVVMALRRRK